MRTGWLIEKESVPLSVENRVRFAGVWNKSESGKDDRQMEELIGTVESLLVENSCVVVPEFGAFVHQAVEAHIDGGTLYPPYTTLSFNRDVQHYDGLIENAYIRRHKTDYRTAKKMVHEAVEELKRVLDASGSIRMGRLGMMRAVEGRYVFEPSQCGFLPQNLGTHPVVLYPLAENRVTIHIRRDYLRYAAACLIGIALLAVSPRLNNDHYADYASMRPIDYAAIIERLHPVEEPEEEAVVVERGRFHVIVASLDERSADRQCEKLLCEGYSEATVLPYKKNLHRVVLASYHSKREALREMENVRRTTPYKRAWVYCE